MDRRWISNASGMHHRQSEAYLGFQQWRGAWGVVPKNILTKPFKLSQMQGNVLETFLTFWKNLEGYIFKKWGGRVKTLGDTNAGSLRLYGNQLWV